MEGDAFAQCDVVNGGTDQLAYLLFTPPHLEAATLALEAYRKRLYPFKQREAQFRDNVGPPPFVHLSKSVIANIDFMKRLSSSNASRASPSTSVSAVSSPDNSSTASSVSGTTASSTSQVTRPLTPAESLRQQYSQRTGHSESTNFEDDSTTASTATAPSKVSDGRMSTSSAKIRELDAVLQRQKKSNEKKDAKQSERVSQIERQLHRINDLDTKLDNVQTDFGLRLNIFETRMVETVKDQMEKLMLVVNSLVPTNESNEEVMQLTSGENHFEPDESAANATQSQSTSVADSGQSDLEAGDQSGSNSNSSSSGSSMSAESTGIVKSPAQKRLKSRTKKQKTPLKESIRRRLDEAMEAAHTPMPNSDSDSSESLTESIRRRLDEVQEAAHTPLPTSEIGSSESFDSLDAALQQMATITNADNPRVPQLLAPVSQLGHPDLESQYKASPSKKNAQKDTNATSSLGRGASS